ncbi:hypothetical protein B0H17DRAFT_1138747 [Mycena rosella]|uniref:F-box domain-containing protein n=1 Tax=Mycena rosella TaxID=1033263 RepID=A0AAD7D5W6_MYCRO|nr:hypothetical protein B0H17DRAFT_1138747 [Mycena rosella]
MSVADLQAHIETVSGEIDRQKEVPTKLNAVRDPVSRLPLEISSAIFIQCLPSSTTPQPGAHEIPMLFLNICNAWTDIALSTPALWEAIHINYPRATGFGQFLATWLSRARNRSLSLSLHGTFDENDATIARGYAERLRSLKIYSDDDDCLDLLEGMSPIPRNAQYQPFTQRIRRHLPLFSPPNSGYVARGTEPGGMHLS